MAEAERLRELALALQGVFAQQAGRSRSVMSFWTCVRSMGRATQESDGWPSVSGADREGRSRNEAGRERRTMIILRAFLALVAGFSTIALLVMCFTGVAGSPDAQLDRGLAAQRLHLRVAELLLFASAGGGYVTAWIAAASPLEHVLILGLWCCCWERWPPCYPKASIRPVPTGAGRRDAARRAGRRAAAAEGVGNFVECALYFFLPLL